MFIQSTRAYTIDQTILIVAIIAIMVTIIVVSIGWSLLNKSAGARLASQLNQIERAIGQFYADHKVWPMDAYTAGPSAYAEHNNLLVLTGASSITYRANISAASSKNYLSGMKYTPQGVLSTYARSSTTGGSTTGGSPTGGPVRGVSGTRSPFPSGPASFSNTDFLGIGAVSNPTPDKNGQFIVLYWHDVPTEDAKDAERIIDGQSGIDYGRGRITLAPGESDSWATTGRDAPITSSYNGGTVNLVYVANAL